MQGYVCVGFVVSGILLFPFILAIVTDRIERNRAKWNYHQSLASLKAHPTNADLRQRTLALGRVYANQTWGKIGVTLFDEVALMNDMNAACAGAVHLPQPAGANPTQPPVEQRLVKLTDLRTKGLIDEEEYRSRKQKILAEV